METSNPFLHLWYRWTPLTASPLRVNVVYRRYTGYRSILDPAAGILTGQPTNEVTILRPPAQAQRRITPNTPMGIRRSTITSSPRQFVKSIWKRAHLPQKIPYARGLWTINEKYFASCVKRISFIAFYMLERFWIHQKIIVIAYCQ